LDLINALKADFNRVWFRSATLETAGTAAHAENNRMLEIDNATLWTNIVRMREELHWNLEAIKSALDGEINAEQKRIFHSHVVDALTAADFARSRGARGASDEVTKLDITICSTRMTEADMRLKWDLKFPHNKLSDQEWNEYWQILSEINPLTDPRHPLGRRAHPIPPDVDVYAVLPEPWHRLSNMVAADPAMAIAMRRAGDGTYYPCRNHGPNPANAPRPAPNWSRAAIASDGTLESLDIIRFNHAENYIWQQARLQLRPAAEPLVSSDVDSASRRPLRSRRCSLLEGAYPGPGVGAMRSC
jgi:hypothetical protein